MKILKNERLINKKLVTGYGILSFDEEGTVLVEDEIADGLSRLKGFTALETAEPPQEPPKPEGDKTPTEGKENTPESDSDEDTDDSDKEETDEDEEPENKAPEGDELNKLTVPALKKLAKDKGIDTSDLTKKDQLIEAILKAEA